MKKVFSSAMVLAISLIAINHAYAASKWVRLGWQGNASSAATISFTPSGNNNNAYVKYGYSSQEPNWQSQDVTFTTTLASITSKHVRLNGLSANSAVHFRICDDGGCGDRFWFKTAPADNSPYVFVAGGDTRSGWTNRRNGNQLIAKIRPLFVMHGGDFTDNNNKSQWTEWLKDWELSYSSDIIDGLSYKRIYPMLSTHGNHEDNDISTICKMFGVDRNQNNRCSADDTYYGVPVSPLLKVYTLNSQFMREGSSLQNAQNNWLETDLRDNGSAVNWRVAQYHKPMFPHYRGKSDNRALFNWWAEDFYNLSMNLVVESDTHLTKLTDVVKPNGDDFRSTSAGTVYVGEGSWGAPARSANDAKSWTVDLASIQQFKVITVSDSLMEVRTAQFNGSPTTLTKAERDADTTLLPSGINWWQANGVGEVMALKTDANNRAVLADNDGGDNDGDSDGDNADHLIAVLDAAHDTFISSSKAGENFDNSRDQLVADGADKTYGETQSLISWDTSGLQACIEVELVEIELNIFNPSSGSYNIYSGQNSWTEGSATWQSVDADNHQGELVGSFTPGSQGKHNAQLNAAGVSKVQSWISGQANHGVVIVSAGTTDGTDFNDKESGTAPKLIINYNEDQCGGGNNQAPTAYFTEQVNGLKVVFSDMSTDTDGSIESWQWQFGDGVTSDDQNPTHTYAMAGSYNVNLTVTDNEGDSNSKTAFVTVVEPDESTQKTIKASDDAFISSRRKNENYDEHKDQLLADASDRTFGSMQTLIKWDVSDIESCASIESATIELDVFNRSPGAYTIFAGLNEWQEKTVTWNSVGGDAHHGSNIGSFTPNETKVFSITLNAAGLSAIQRWLLGNNHGVVIASGGTRNGIDIYDRETAVDGLGKAPKITLTYNLDQCPN